MNLIDQDITSYGVITENFIKNYNKGVVRHENIIKSIETSLSNQKDIDYHIQETNNRIYQSVEARKIKNLASQKREMEKNEQEKVFFL